MFRKWLSVIGLRVFFCKLWGAAILSFYKKKKKKRLKDTSGADPLPIYPTFTEVTAGIAAALLWP